jgi:hypothetical protein
MKSKTDSRQCGHGLDGHKLLQRAYLAGHEDGELKVLSLAASKRM